MEGWVGGWGGGKGLGLGVGGWGTVKTMGVPSNEIFIYLFFLWNEGIYSAGVHDHLQFGWYRLI